MLYILIIFLISIQLNASSSADNMPDFSKLKVYEIDIDNKLSLLDTALIYEEEYKGDKSYNDTTLMKNIFEISYPNNDFFKEMYYRNWNKLDTTYDDGITTYNFSFWCQRDTVGRKMDEKGQNVFDIEFRNCKIQDILKYDEKGRLVHYTYRAQNKDVEEGYKYNEKDQLVRIHLPKGVFNIHYDDYGRIDKVVEEYENAGSLIETMGKSVKREIIYDFQYE